MILVPLNLRGIIVISVALTGLMIVHIQMNSKEKTEYEKTTGKIIFLDKQLGQLPLRNPGKYRYLEVEGYEYPFEIFVGKESGDFKPKFEKIDKLKLSDTITVFYYQTENVKNEGINRFIQFIDKKDESYFEKGNSGKTSGAVVISIGILLTIGGLILWRMKKIKF